jgi:hypothetical protein
MAGKCVYCGFTGTNEEMEKHAGEMCQGDFQPDDMEQNFNSLQQLKAEIAAMADLIDHANLGIEFLSYKDIAIKLRQLSAV